MAEFTASEFAAALAKHEKVRDRFTFGGFPREDERRVEGRRVAVEGSARVPQQQQQQQRLAPNDAMDVDNADIWQALESVFASGPNKRTASDLKHQYEDWLRSLSLDDMEEVATKLRTVSETS